MKIVILSVFFFLTSKLQNILFKDNPRYSAESLQNNKEKFQYSPNLFKLNQQFALHAIFSSSLFLFVFLSSEVRSWENSKNIYDNVIHTKVFLSSFERYGETMGGNEGNTATTIIKFQRLSVDGNCG